MKLYVASAFQDFERTRAVHKLARSRYHEVTEDWSRHVGTPLPEEPEARRKFEQEAALADVFGVQEADVLILLTPAADRKDMGCGMWVELGVAIAMGIPIVVTGGQHDRTIFTRLDDVVHVETDAETVIAAEEAFKKAGGV